VVWKVRAARTLIHPRRPAFSGGRMNAANCAAVVPLWGAGAVTSVWFRRSLRRWKNGVHLTPLMADASAMFRLYFGMRSCGTKTFVVYQPVAGFHFRQDSARGCFLITADTTRRAALCVASLVDVGSVRFVCAPFVAACLTVRMRKVHDALPVCVTRFRMEVIW